MLTTFTRPANSDSLYWVAMHYLDGSAVFLRTGHLSSVITPDTSANPLWRKIRGHTDHWSRTLETKLYGPYADAAAADVVAEFLIATEQPHCNVNFTGDTVETHAPRKVVCRETGRIFASRNQCATYYELDPAALGRHLKKRTGFRSVKGKTFVFYDELPADQQEAVERMHAALK